MMPRERDASLRTAMGSTVYGGSRNEAAARGESEVGGMVALDGGHGLVRYDAARRIPSEQEIRHAQHRRLNNKAPSRVRV